MENEDKERLLRNFALRVADFVEYDSRAFFNQRTKTIKKCDQLITDIKLAENVSIFKYSIFKFSKFYIS